MMTCLLYAIMQFGLISTAMFDRVDWPKSIVLAPTYMAAGTSSIALVWWLVTYPTTDQFSAFFVTLALIVLVEQVVFYSLIGLAAFVVVWRALRSR